MISGKPDNTSKSISNNISNNISKNPSNNISKNTSNNISERSPSDHVSENEPENIIVHVMYIKDIQKYTKLHICPKCRYIPSGVDHGSYKKERFEEHVENCDGKLVRKLRLNEQSVPFIPHIQKILCLLIF
jgi:hypothetical protein